MGSFSERQVASFEPGLELQLGSGILSLQEEALKPLDSAREGHRFGAEKPVNHGLAFSGRRLWTQVSHQLRN
jgi:hypothetical protein